MHTLNVLLSLSPLAHKNNIKRSDCSCHMAGVSSLDYLYLYDYLNDLESLEGLSGLQNVTTGIYISNAKKLKCAFAICS